MRLRHSLLPAAVLLVAWATFAAATPTGSAFTYQGLLKSAGTPADGAFDFVFRLWDSASGGTQISTDQPALGVAVTGGLFSVPVDFGSGAFDGNARWLEIQVRVAGGGAYTPLTPREPVAAAPYAVRALNSAGGSSQWSNDANGIDYVGLVGIGIGSVAGQRLRIDGGTNYNPLVVTNSTANNATLAIGNSASNGLGFYDATSARHYITGKLGLGTLSPSTPLHVMSQFGQSIRAEATGTIASNGYSAAVIALGYTGTGLFGSSAMGTYSSSVDDRGVWGLSTNNIGVVGDNQAHSNSGWLGGITEGVYGQATSASYYGGRFYNSASGGVALRVDGLQQVKTIQILGGSDLAEPFDVSAPAASAPDPGSVVVIDPAKPGELRVSEAAYDPRVAGVISGANHLAPGMVMQSDGTALAHGDHPVALTGRVWCKVDAGFGAVHPGDLLTTSPTPGHAMVANDAARRQGAVIGKAMTSLEAGRGLVLVLVSLQ
ncbi:MAG TPA: hypothetical protein VFK69_00425 [Candidatus Eisenbacteria bacterium]|nr:hypothetical protein [Candidatus Eisenbacteria bacterium]